MPTIFTHMNPDLDAVSSVWAAVEYIPRMRDADIEFRPSNWDGSGMTDDDLAVDLPAGKRGLKGEHRDDVVHSCFALLMHTYAPPLHQQALARLIGYIDIEDAYGKAERFLLPDADRDARRIIESVSLNAIFRGLRRVLGDDRKTIRAMFEIFSSLRENELARLRAETEAQTVEYVSRRVVIVREGRERGTNDVLFDRGVLAVIYKKDMSVGILIKGDAPIRTNHPDLLAVVETADERDLWFSHPAGFLLCKGSGTSPATTPSRVDPMDLARVAARLIDGITHQPKGTDDAHRT